MAWRSAPRSRSACWSASFNSTRASSATRCGAGRRPRNRPSAGCSTSSAARRRSRRRCSPRSPGCRRESARTARCCGLPSLLAGVATIPIVYAIGLRVSRRAAFVAALLAALSPFLIWFSVELRAYSLLVALVAGSTLTLLLAIDRRNAWWVAYAALSCAAMYTHYTAAYVLAAQLVWVLAFRPEARRPALIANAGAALAYLPWAPSLLDDLRAPSQGIIEVLAPFGSDTFTDYTLRAALGSPAVELRDLIGIGGIAVLACGLAVAVAGIVARRRREGPDPDRAGRKDLLDPARHGRGRRAGRSRPGQPPRRRSVLAPEPRDLGAGVPDPPGRPADGGHGI